MGLSDSQTSLQLDEVLLTFMDQLEELEEKRGRLNSLIEQVWVSAKKHNTTMSELSEYM